MKKTLSAAMMMTLAAAMSSPQALAALASRTVGSRVRRKPRPAFAWKPNGERECARRRRQIAAGLLRHENGLCITSDERVADRGFELVPRLRKWTLEW